jgi:serine O-acetyltransferase
MWKRCFSPSRDRATQTCRETESPIRLVVRLHLIAHELTAIPVVGWPLAKSVYWLSKALTSSDIDPRADIHPTVSIPHATGVVIGETAVVGARSVIMPGVVVGARSWDAHDRHAKIGADVVIGSGAVLLGPVRVGDGARIGANSVVLRDVEPGMTVIGSPARPIASLETD